MNDVPRSTVIILLTVTVLVSVLGTVAVLSTTKLTPPLIVDRQPYSLPEPPAGQNNYEPAEATGLVSMEITYPPDDPRSETFKQVTP